MFVVSFYFNLLSFSSVVLVLFSKNVKYVNIKVWHASLMLIGMMIWHVNWNNIVSNNIILILWYFKMILIHLIKFLNGFNFWSFKFMKSFILAILISYSHTQYLSLVAYDLFLFLTIIISFSSFDLLLQVDVDKSSPINKFNNTHYPWQHIQ